MRADGRKELIALTDGYRESSGFWGALREVFPETREQRCWFHYADLRVMPTSGRESLCQAVPALKKSA
jgi:transposase-like protein